MENKLTQELAASMEGFHLPRYNRLPDMGLYLEQTTKYINQCLAPLGCFEITGSMIRNYVKMGLVAKPDQKQYYVDQIAHLIAITLLKSVLPLESVQRMFRLQRAVYTDETAYDYFCMELENVLYYRFGLTDAMQDLGETSSLEKEMLRSAIASISHIIHLSACFRLLPEEPQSTAAKE